jgi:methionyl-tRNA formyltransferase
MNIIIASNRPFPNRDARNPEELNGVLSECACIFFPYWSWKIPLEITSKHNCIGFHTGDTNGGSPIQNLIRRGNESSHIRMFKIDDTIDGGEIIDVSPISLLGSLEEIIIRQTEVIREMIHEYIHSN